MSIVKNAIAGGLLGVTIYFAADVAGEYTTYVILRDQAVALAGRNGALEKQIGSPFTLGPWYNARIGAAAHGQSARWEKGLRQNGVTEIAGLITTPHPVLWHPCQHPCVPKLAICQKVHFTTGFSSARNIAQCSFQLQGQRQITDVTVRGVRRPGTYSNTLMYNALGGGSWMVVDCTAMFPSGGGLVKPQSLMPEGGRGNDGVQRAEGSGGAVSGECSTCASPAEEGGRKKPGVAHPGGVDSNVANNIDSNISPKEVAKKKSWWR